MAGVGGADVLVRGDHVGMRATARVYLLMPFYEADLADVLFWSPQYGLEALYQF